MRVLQVYRDYFSTLPGGIERHVHELVHGLRPDVQTEALVSSRSRRSFTHMDGDVPVHFIAEYGRFQGIPVSPGFSRAMTRGDYDVLHLHSPNPTGEMAARFSRSRAARVVTYHATTQRGARFRPLYEAFLSNVLRGSRRVIASSESLVNRTPLLARLRERRSDALAIVPFGVDVERFAPGPTPISLELRESWGEGPTILFLGRLRYYKGLEYLIEAASSLEAKLVMIGDGLERARIESMGRSLLGERFIFVPEVLDERVADTYRAADVFCLPSTSDAEAFGISALEAMACGVPAVTTEVGTATSAINKDGVTGFVVPPADPEALSAALTKILDDPSLAAELGSAARKRVLQHYDRRVMLQRILHIYDQAIAEQGTIR